MEQLSPCRGFIRGTWRAAPFLETLRHVTEGFGNEASHSSQRICDGNIKEELL
jgi:hypothetical protein